MFSWLFLAFSLVSSAANATCVVKKCYDSDGGNQPQTPGYVKQLISCAAPGGVVNTSESTDTDSCAKGIHREYVCEMNPYTQSLTSVVKFHKCKCNSKNNGCELSSNQN